MFTDSHCHIEDDQTLYRAYQAGVTTILNAGKDLDEIEAQLLKCERFSALKASGEAVPALFSSAGIHPDAAATKLSRISVDDIVRAAQHPSVIAIGECGLDYHYGKEFKNEQKEMFARCVEAAGITGLPLMIHQRDAEKDLLNILKDGIKKYGNINGVIHCFCSTKDFAQAINALGFYISASGIVTFKNAGEIAEVFASYPLEKILIETDSPYLAPVPYRGKTNEPAFIIKTAEKIAALRGLTNEKIARITTENFYNLYHKKTRR